MSRLGERARSSLRSRLRRRIGAEAAFASAVRDQLHRKPRVSLVQVGANDGGVADPVSPIVKTTPEQFRLLLIEPQRSVVGLLSATYADHVDATIATCAVGELGTFSLFTVKPEYWSDCRPPYAKGWPVHRAPTGIASGDRGRVEGWVRRYYRGPMRPSDVVEELTVQCMPLRDVMAAHHFQQQVDVLVVDAEGFDDVVLRESDLEGLRPAVVFYEHFNLSAERQAALSEELIRLGYRLTQDDQNTCAVHAGDAGSAGGHGR